MILDSSALIADPELIDGLEEEAAPIFCGEDTVLFRQGDPPSGIYILKSGEVELEMKSPLNALVLSLQAKRGSVLGLPALIGEVACTLTATALAGAELGYIAREEFTRLMQTRPPLAMKVLTVLAAQVRSAHGALLLPDAEAGPGRGRLTPSRQP